MIAQKIKTARDAGDLGLIPGAERSPGEWNGNLLQYYNRVVPNRKRSLSRLYIVTLLI